MGERRDVGTEDEQRGAEHHREDGDVGGPGGESEAPRRRDHEDAREEEGDAGHPDRGVVLPVVGDPRIGSVVGEQRHDRELQQREADGVLVPAPHPVGIGRRRSGELDHRQGVDLEAAEVEVPVEDCPDPEVVPETVGPDRRLVQVGAPRLQRRHRHEHDRDDEAREPGAHERRAPTPGCVRRLLRPCVSDGALRSHNRNVAAV